MPNENEKTPHLFLHWASRANHPPTPIRNCVVDGLALTQSLQGMDGTRAAKRAYPIDPLDLRAHGVLGHFAKSSRNAQRYERQQYPAQVCAAWVCMPVEALAAGATSPPTASDSPASETASTLAPEG